MSSRARKGTPSAACVRSSLVNELASRLDRASSTHGRRPPVLPTDSSSSSSASSASATPSPPSCEPSLAVAVRLARLNASLLNDDDVDDSKDMSSGGGSWFAGMAVPFPSATFWRRNDSNASRRLDGRCQALLPVVAPQRVAHRIAQRAECGVGVQPRCKRYGLRLRGVPGLHLVVRRCGWCDIFA